MQLIDCYFFVGWLSFFLLDGEAKVVIGIIGAVDDAGVAFRGV